MGLSSTALGHLHRPRLKNRDYINIWPKARHAKSLLWNLLLDMMMEENRRFAFSGNRAGWHFPEHENPDFTVSVLSWLVHGQYSLILEVEPPSGLFSVPSGKYFASSWRKPAFGIASNPRIGQQPAARQLRVAGVYSKGNFIFSKALPGPWLAIDWHNGKSVEEAAREILVWYLGRTINRFRIDICIHLRRLASRTKPYIIQHFHIATAVPIDKFLRARPNEKHRRNYPIIESFLSNLRIWLWATDNLYVLIWKS